MTYSFDPELMDVIKQMAAAGAATPVAERDDWRALRATSEAGLWYMEIPTAGALNSAAARLPREVRGLR